MNDKASFISDVDTYLYVLENVRTEAVKLSQFMDTGVWELFSTAPLGQKTHLPVCFVKKLDTNTLPIYA